MKDINEMTANQLKERSILLENQEREMRSLLEKIAKERQINPSVDTLDQLKGLLDLSWRHGDERKKQFKAHEKAYEDWMKVKNVIRMGKENSEYIEEEVRKKEAAKKIDYEVLAAEIFAEEQKKNKERDREP